MKYLRKIVWLVIAVVFLASVIIGIGIIFSVKNVNVTLKSYTYSADEEAEAAIEINGIKKTVLNKYGGKLISYVNGEDLAECFTDTDYILESYERHYPCTLNITVRERKELFAVAMENGTYSTYDSTGMQLRSNLSEEEAMNKVDKAPNVLVTSSTEDYHITDTEIKEVAKISSIFADKFASLRSVVEKIELRPRSNIIISLRCGISIYLADYTERTEDKLEAVYNKFMSLTGEEKLSGMIHVGIEIGSGKLNVERYP